MNWPKQCRKLISFRKDFQAKSSKITCPHSCWRHGHTIFSLDKKVFIFLNYCYWVYKHTQVHFLPDCSFKICEKPTKFSRKCPRSYCHVRVVNGYADTASIYLLFPWHRSLQFFVFVNYILGFERLWKWFNLVILLFVKLIISEYRFYNSYQKYKQTSLLAYVETSTSAMLMQQIQLMISELVAAMLVSWCLAGWSNIILQHLSRIISKRVIHRRATFTQSQKSLYSMYCTRVWYGFKPGSLPPRVSSSSEQ